MAINPARKQITETVERYVRRKTLKAIFPSAGADLIKKADTLKAGILGRKTGYLLGLYNGEQKLLLTNEEVAAALPLEKLKGFSPAFVLKSHSDRARFGVTAEGRVVEFKGTTPIEFYPDKTNPNSGDPEGLLSLEAAKNEARGLTLIGELETQVVDLGEFFTAYKGFAQLYRAGKAGNRYFPWLRLDSPLTVTQLLAELEEKPLEQFLFDSGERSGRQLKKLHDTGYTLHNPWREGEILGRRARAPLTFSSLHPANVEIHGNIVDTEGMRTFEAAKELFWRRLSEDPKVDLDPDEKKDYETGKKSPAYFSRLCDIQRLIGGAHKLDRSLLGVLGEQQFLSLLSGLLKGYYRAPDQEIRPIIEELKESFTRARTRAKTLPIQSTHLRILSRLEPAA